MGLPAADFWEQTEGSWAALMLGALRRRRAQAEQARDLALMTAYFGAQLTQCDWAKSHIGSFSEWRDKLLGKTPPISSAERFAAFSALAEQGFAVTVTETVQ